MTIKQHKLTGEPAPPDLIIQIIGEFGRWQLWLVVLIFLLKIPIAQHQLCIVFMMPPQNFTCSDPGMDQCDANCSSHVFDKSEFTETIVSQWDLVCEYSWLANFSQTVSMFGILIGNSIFGILSDKFGRKIILLVAIILQGVAGPLVALVPWYELFIVLRFLVTMATGGTMITSFVLLMEIIGTKYRTITCVLYQLPFNLGHLLLPLYSYFLRNWQHYYLLISTPTVLFILYFFVIPESPRWLITIGRTDRAVSVLEKAAKCNGKPTENIKSDVEHSTGPNRSNVKKGNVWDLFRTPNLRFRTLILCYLWFMCGFCFFGVAQYIGTIGANIFLNVALSAAVQMPGTVIVLFVMEKWGRKFAVIVSSIVGGIALFIIAFLPKDEDVAIAILGMIGILGMWMCFPTLYQMSGELYPTKLRNTGMGLCSVVCRIGSMIAPFTLLLDQLYVWIPPVLFSIVSIIGAVVTLFLPETKGCALPDTIEEAENFSSQETR